MCTPFNLHPLSSSCRDRNIDQKLDNTIPSSEYAIMIVRVGQSILVEALGLAMKWLYRSWVLSSTLTENLMTCDLFDHELRSQDCNKTCPNSYVNYANYVLE